MTERVSPRLGPDGGSSPLRLVKFKNQADFWICCAIFSAISIWTVWTGFAHHWSVWEWSIGVVVNLSFWCPLLIDGCTKVEVEIDQRAVTIHVWNPFSGWESASFKASEYDDIGSIGWTFKDAMFRLRSGEFLEVRMPYSKGMKVHQMIKDLRAGEGG